MKKLLLIVLAAVVVVGAGVLAHGRYKTYQDKKNAVAAIAEQKRVDEVKEAQTAVASLHGKYDALRIECEKGHGAYESLTAALRAKTPEPICGPAIVQ